MKISYIIFMQIDYVLVSKFFIMFPKNFIISRPGRTHESLGKPPNVFWILILSGFKKISKFSKDSLNYLVRLTNL